MFKTVVIAALGFAAASAQFLSERDLQAGTFTTLCTFASGVDSCGAGYCCARYTRAGAAPAAPFAANVCAPVDFIGNTLTIATVATAFTGCLNPNATLPGRSSCTNSTGCPSSMCCSNVTMMAGATGATGSATKAFCVFPASAPNTTATYTAAAWNTGFTSMVSSSVCVANPAAPVDGTSFGSYIKASVMMVLAVLSVAMF